MRWSVFSKPWPDASAEQLVELLQRHGLDGVELPIRDGFPISPSTVDKELPAWALALRSSGLRIDSVASTPDERLLAACAESDVDLVRVMIRIEDSTYQESEAKAQRWLDTMTPLSDKYGVRIGIQPHHGRYVSDASGLRALLADRDPRHVAAIWDAGHDALAGQQPDLGLDLVYSHLAMVNLKNARYVDREPEWVTGDAGLAHWPTVAAELIKRGYDGPICFTAQYTDSAKTDDLLAADIAYAKRLFTP